MENLLGKDINELRQVAALVGLPPFAAKQMAGWLYARGVETIDEMTNISLAARQRLQQDFRVGRSSPVDAQHSADGTIKYLYSTEGGHFIETVYIPDGDRATLCVSSQVGCKMGCRFCMTGRQGFDGQLSATDILNQVYSLPERDRLTNIVFMGQGEPFDNLDAVLRATQLLMADYGWGWSPRRITVSTVGLRKGMERFLHESPCHLAVSLHNPFPGERREMMPAERAFSLTEFLSLLAREDWTHQRRLSFEYIVFGGLNDTPRHARELARLLSPLHCRVNLIRFHDIPDSPYHKADETTMEWLRDYLTRHGITATIRASRGEDIMAACGLLSTLKK
ncbi:MAG: 23S rRNA (adenine(2503)-C(2))-methyltransferase RlmN [Bacteroidaceae bacterium]|nr:23S rRNA (adenine(2503)-C(2))-methyltransferase RlmN [Bacteroidaceae bacterium]